MGIFFKSSSKSVFPDISKLATLYRYLENQEMSFQLGTKKRDLQCYSRFCAIIWLEARKIDDDHHGGQNHL